MPTTGTHGLRNRYEPVRELKDWLRVHIQRKNVSMYVDEDSLKFQGEDNQARRYLVVSDGDNLRGLYSGAYVALTREYAYKLPLIVAFEYPEHDKGAHVIMHCTGQHHARAVWLRLRPALVAVYRSHGKLVEFDLSVRDAEELAARWRNYLHSEMERAAV